MRPDDGAIPGHQKQQKKAQNQRSSVGSVEYQDDGTDPEYYHHGIYMRKKGDFHTLEMPMVPKRQNGYFGGISGYWNIHLLRKRIKDFEKKEAMSFLKQMCLKVDKILHDQKLEMTVYDFLIRNPSQRNTDVNARMELFRIKYGEDLTTWLNKLPPNCKRAAKHLKEIFANHTHVSKMGVAMVDALQHIETYKSKDPLSNWCDFHSEAADRIIQRIQEFATFVVGMIRWSFLIEPGRPRTDLSEFFVEFEVVEGFFENSELSRNEMSQSAFDANYATKARNRRIVCGDLNRVVLKLDKEDGNGNRTLLRPIDVFGDFDCPSVKYQEDGGESDFIHANYVFGGPLINKFILTQAPMSSTTIDFWRMVWQEKSEYVVMLCGAMDTDNMTMLGTDKPSNYCPYYWPKVQGSILTVGSFVIRNDSICMTMDPLFSVTSLSMWRSDDPTEVHRLQHWQYDWKDYTDVQWPLRILRRTRTSPNPSVIHCLDGCGRSGTLVLIEIMLMQLLRGSNNFANPMLTSAIFLRLQRRNAVANNLQYLFAYRVVLHWCQPYVLSAYNRLCLGFLFDNSGFCGKFAELAAAFSRQSTIHRKIR
ncbi:unnamed protein product [Bursaphelenchus xylophilus]|uniref:(pine wood nematode) hypothetical protein n=1 Tax=Bursaphelenchus xylophilus TaxID=6326 RepID=A0A1I7STU6_BURXY|nr:unnamed protein product [Bursaphelenchus xylophilus]CAG9107948.1 unnamed protein product [Bursaphelenchus xylophilus]